MTTSKDMQCKNECEIVTLISLTSTEISVSKPLSTCKEFSNSSVMPIFACIHKMKLNFYHITFNLQ